MMLHRTDSQNSPDGQNIFSPETKPDRKWKHRGGPRLPGDNAADRCFDRGGEKTKKNKKKTQPCSVLLCASSPLFIGLLSSTQTEVWKAKRAAALSWPVAALSAWSPAKYKNRLSTCSSALLINTSPPLWRLVRSRQQYRGSSEYYGGGGEHADGPWGGWGGGWGRLSIAPPQGRTLKLVQCLKKSSRNYFLLVLHISVKATSSEQIMLQCCLHRGIRFFHTVTRK